jgi:hypothetical protein
VRRIFPHHLDLDFDNVCRLSTLQGSLMNDRTTLAKLDGDDGDSSENPIGASIKIDFAAIMALTEPDQPGGRIVFNSDDYDTDEAADAALEEFFTRIIEAPYEEEK